MCSSGCNCWALVLGVLFGIIVAILFAFGLIPGITLAVWIAFGIGVLLLLVLTGLIAIAAKDRANALDKCLCKNGVCLLISALGTIISTIAALSISLVPYSLLIIALVFIAAAFFGVLVLSFIALLICVIKKMCRCFDGDKQ